MTAELACHVLVVDDDPANLEMIERRLEVEGITVELVETGQAAIDAAARTHFSAVLLDLRLPDMSGMEVLAALHAPDPDLPVVIMTAHGSEAIAAQAITAGAADYLVKPVGRRELVAALVKAIERNRVRGESRRVQHNLSETVSALSERLRRAERDHARLVGLVETIDDGVLLAGGDGQIAWINDAACRLLRLEGRPADFRSLLTDVAGITNEAGREVPLAVNGPHGLGKLVDAEYVVRWHDGVERAFSVSVTGVAEGEGIAPGLVIVFRDITDRRTQRLRLEALIAQQEREIEAAHAQRQIELARASASVEQLKTGILAAVSHELRTPLNFIVGFGSVLVDGLVGELTPEQLRLVERMLMGAERLTLTVEELLDYAMLSADMIALEHGPLDPAEVAHEAVESARKEADSRAIALDFEGPRAPLRVVGDRGYVFKLVRQLVFNAIKFTPEHGRVRVVVTADSAARQAVIAVEDTGIGIAPEAMPRLFDRFFQVESRATRRFGGTGLGLALVKGLAELMGGRIEVESELGRGSTFRVRLPLAP